MRVVPDLVQVRKTPRDQPTLAERRVVEACVGQRQGEPGVALPLVMLAASGNPLGLIVSSAAKAEGEISGRTTIDGAAKRTAKEIADRLQVAFRKQGWI